MLSAESIDALALTAHTTSGIPPEPEWMLTQQSSSQVAASFPLDQTFALHSYPQATKTIYLDFDGHETLGTFWNDAYGTVVTPAYSTEGGADFSDNELQRIQRIWERVAEDFSPFEVNVTTEDPGVEALRNSGGGDQAWGIRVVIGEEDWYPDSAGGVAYVGSFSWDSDTPTFVFNTSEVGVFEAISHEVGHTLGLKHDGQSFDDGQPDVEYYAGHGQGATSWAPIMGSAYSVNVSQWSLGEYPDASQSQDDLQIITTENGFNYRSDDHGGGFSTASPLSGSDAFLGTGIIERSTDVDYHKFTTVGGLFQIQVDPFYLSPNLDIEASLYDSSQQLVASSNPDDRLDATLVVDLVPGEYFLAIDGVGRTGNGVDDFGYSDYGSLGQYTIEAVESIITAIVSVDHLLTANASPTITGLVSEPLAEVRVTVGTQTDLLAINNGDGTWTLPAGSFGPLADGVYEVTASATIGKGVGFDTTAGELTIDTDGGRAVVRNPDRIAIPGEGTSGPASPYGSVINVDSIDGTLSSLKVRLLDLGHTYPGDLQVLLAGPGGQTVVLMADAGGSTDVTGIDLTFDDGALGPLGNNGLQSGSYQPSNLTNITNLPFPAPAGPYGQTLEVFEGLPVNGTWTLYINDDAGSDLGALAGGWELDLDVVGAPRVSVEPTLADRSEGDSATTEFTFTVTRTGDISLPTTIDWSLAGSDGFDPGDVVATTGSETIAADDATATISVFVRGDDIVENDEAFTLSLDGASFGTIDRATAAGVIRNDDLATLTIADASGEEGELLTFVVTLDRAVPGGPFLVTAIFGSPSDTADPTDYGAPEPINLVFTGTAGETQSFTIEASDDSEIEGTETFQVLLDVINQPIQILANATGTILDNDFPPSTTITAIQRYYPVGNPTNQDFVQFLVTFSEPVSLVGPADFFVTGGSGAAVVGVARVSATQRRVTVMGGALAGFDGEIGLALGQGYEVLGVDGRQLPPTGPPAGENESYTLDNTAPVVSVTDATTTLATPLLTGAVDSTATQVFVSVAGRPPATATLANNEWSYRVAPGLSPGTYTVQTQAFDSAGNIGLATGQITIQATTPTVVSIERAWPLSDPTNQDSAQFLVRFSAPVGRVLPADFTVTSGSTASVVGVARLGPQLSRVTVNGGDLADFDGPLGLRLSDAFRVQDSNGLPLPPTGPPTEENEFFTLDNTPPDYLITRQADERISGPTATFRLLFDEAVTGVDPTDFVAIASSGVTTGAITVNQLSGFEYQIGVTGVVGEGTLGLALANPGGLADPAGNGAGVATLSEAYTIFDDSVVIPDVTLLRTQTAPIIDGVPDALWAGVPLLQLNVNWRGSADSPEDASVQWKAIWSDAAIHYLFIVRDDVLYLDNPNDAFNDDGIELFLDPNRSRGQSYDGFDDTKLTLRPLDRIAQPGSQVTHVEDWSQVTFATASNPAGPGYIIEASVPWSVLNTTPTPGKQIGFELALLDDDDGGSVRISDDSPDGRLLWRDTSNRSPFRPDAFSTAELSASTISLPAAGPTAAALTGVVAAPTGIASDTRSLSPRAGYRSTARAEAGFDAIGLLLAESVSATADAPEPLDEAFAGFADEPDTDPEAVAFGLDDFS